MNRGENAGQRIGGAQGVDQAATGQPDLVTRADFGGDRREPHRQIVDEEVTQAAIEPLRQPPTPNESRARQVDIEIAQDAARAEAAAPLLEAIEVSGRVAPAGDRPNRRARDDVRPEPLADQRADHANVSEAARRPAAEG